jgi:hypothetical protein
MHLDRSRLINCEAQSSGRSNSNVINIGEIDRCQLRTLLNGDVKLQAKDNCVAFGDDLPSEP